VLSARAADNRLKQCKTAGSFGVMRGVVCVNNRLNRIEAWVLGKRDQGAANGRFAAEQAILLGHFAPGAEASPRRDHDRRD
jgi:hypothetical protein